MTNAISEEFKTEPFWREHAPRPQLPDINTKRKFDVCIIGSGFTGLSAAIEIASAERSVLVIEGASVGFGCSTRNGGQITGRLPVSHETLINKYGETSALGMLREAQQAPEFLADFIAKHNIECNLERNGGFVGACHPSQYEVLARDAEFMKRRLGTQVDVVPRSEQHKEVVTDEYYGGRLMHRHGALHPGLFHNALVALSTARGVNILQETPAIAIRPDSGGFGVITPRGEYKCRQAIVATNGYTRIPTAGLRRRILPVASHVIATSSFPPEVLSHVMPQDRVYADTRPMLYYYRKSPDKTRILFGTRPGYFEISHTTAAVRMHKSLLKLFPSLGDFQISHCWKGYVAVTFDSLPHLGKREGIFYAMGCNGNGIAMMTYLGRQIALQALGKSEGRTQFDNLEFPTRALYTGSAWMLPPVLAYYDLKDFLENWRQAR